MLSTSVFALLVTVLVGAYLYGQESTVLSGNRMRALLLAEEGLEAVKNIKDEDWDNLSDGTYGLQISGDQWELSESSDNTDIFTREIIISSAGSDRKNITANITWQQNLQRNGLISLNTMLSYWEEVVTTITNMGDWSNAIESAALDSDGGQNGLKVSVEGDYAYLIRQGGDSDLEVINISTHTNPLNIGSFSVPGTPYNIDVEGNYAYVATSDNGEEFVVIDVSNPNSLQKASALNLPGNQNARGVFIEGTTAYLVRDSSSQEEFYIIDISNPTNPSIIGSIDLNSGGNEVIVIGNYAYCGTDGDELEVIDISNKTSPQSIAKLDLSTGADGLAITGENNTIYIGRSNGRIESIDISEPTSPNKLGSIDYGAAIRDLDLASGTNIIFAASDENSAELQIIDMNTPSSPIMTGIFNASRDFNGVDYVEEKDIVVVAGENNSKELIIVQPQS